MLISPPPSTPQVTSGQISSTDTTAATAHAFNGKLAHQIRTSITALQGTHFLLSRQLPQHSETVAKQVGRLLDLQREAIEGLKATVDQFLEFSSVDYLAQHEPFAPHDIGSLFAHLLLPLRAAAPATRVSFQDFLPPRFQAEANHALLELIITNLVTNALKFSPAESAVSISLAPHSTGWAVTVEDRGRGILPEEQHRVFEPFVRASHAGTTPGAGLGLAIVRRAVTHSGGSISLQSSAESGTQVAVRFPLSLPHRSSNRPRP